MKASGFGRWRVWLSVAVAAASLAACGGGGGNTAGPTLGGTAAVGVPIVGGTVRVSCSGGSALQTLTSSTGGWTVAMSGQTLPCAVQVTGGTVGGAANSTPYHSIALSLGTVNITPLTDLVVARLLGANPQTWFASPTFTGVGSDALRTALDAVSTALGMTATLGTRNPLTSSFQAVNGDLIDDILEAYRAALAALTAAHADLIAAALAGDFSAYGGFANAFQTAYTDLGSNGGGGGGGGGGGAGTLTVNVTISGVAASSINVGSVPMPSSQAEFCDSLSTDSTFSSIGESGGGTLTINSCSFSGNTGTVNATLSITSPIAMTIPYVVTYVYN